MNKKINALIQTIFPNKKENIFIISLVLLGIIAGSIFILFISKEDIALMTNRITNFFNSVKENKIEYGQVLANGLILNLSYTLIMWILGISIIGIPINLFLVFFKSFIISFTLGSLIKVYKLKGLLASSLYAIPIQLINIIIIITIGIYTYNFSKKLIISLKTSQNNFFKKSFKKYFIILICTLFLSTISVLLETYYFPTIIKIIINFFV